MKPLWSDTTWTHGRRQFLQDPLAGFARLTSVLDFVVQVAVVVVKSVVMRRPAGATSTRHHVSIPNVTVVLLWVLYWTSQILHKIVILSLSIA